MYWKEEAEKAAERNLFVCNENYNSSLRIVLQKIFVAGWEACRNSSRCITCKFYESETGGNGRCFKGIKVIDRGFGCILGEPKEEL